jgi:hypothetical protein
MTNVSFLGVCNMYKVRYGVRSWIASKFLLSCRCKKSRFSSTKENNEGINSYNHLHEIKNVL